MHFLTIVFLFLTVTTEVIVSMPKYDVTSMIRGALYFGKREHERQQHIDKNMLAKGIDMKDGKTKKHGGGATCNHQLGAIFNYMRNETFTQTNHAFVGLHATRELSSKLHKSVAQIKEYASIMLKWKTLFGQICNPRMPTCPPITKRIRTTDGSCNNHARPTLGMANRPQKRYLPPAYDDGVSSPRTKGVSGKPLPSPRLVSNLVHKPIVSDLVEHTQTVIVMQFGQLLDHDLTDTPMLKGADKADLECCKISPLLAKNRHACFPITIPKTDKRFFTRCMNFARSAPGTNDDCGLDYRNQINQLSAYIDGSFLYFANEENMHRIRKYRGGRLVMDHRGLFGQHENPKNCMKKQPGDYCMKSGDRKIHVVPTLTAIETIFLREHNRIADGLAIVNPHWDDETIFQTTRNIMSAMTQHITYNEYLPIILGPATMKKYQLKSKPVGHDTHYDSTVDVTIANVFSVAAFRFGHSQVPGIVGLIDKDMTRKWIDLEDTYNKPATVLTDNGSDRINRWQLLEQTAKSDRFLERAVRDELFVDDDGDAFDLASLNIQRGRDHGIQGYNAWRRWCGLSTAIHFGTQFGGLVDMDPIAAGSFSRLYSHPDDIDLFPAAMSEVHLPGAEVGPTFACILGKQFQEIKYGDRFWYENNFPATGFSAEQLYSIKKVQLSRLMCNGLGDRFIQKDVFHIPTKGNPSVACHDLPDVDLNLWKVHSFIGYKPPYSPISKLFNPNVQVGQSIYGG